MIRILLIPSSDYLGHPFPQRHNNIFERVHDDKDFEVHVIWFDIFGKATLPSKCIIHEIPLEFSVKNVPVYYLSNAINYLYEILKIIKNESIDIVVAGNLLPPLLLKIYSAISSMRIPFIFDLQDYYPTSATGYICSVNSLLGGFVKGVFECMTQTLLKTADVVTVPGIALAMYARSIRGNWGYKKIYVIPNGISEHFLTKHDGRKIRENLGFGEDDLVVGYIGSIEFWLDMKTLIKALSIASREGLKIKFMLVGGRLQTRYAEKVNEWIKHYGLEKITSYVGFIKYEKVPEYIAAMDVGTIPFDVNNPTAYYAAPNKMWEYLSQGINVISTPLPESLAYKNFINIVSSEKDYVVILKKLWNAENAKRSREEKHLQENLEIKKCIEKRTWKRSAELFKEIISKIVRNKQ